MKKLWVLSVICCLVACAGADGKTPRRVVIEADICGYTLYRDSRHDVCWLSIWAKPVLVPCELIERCLDE